MKTFGIIIAIFGGLAMLSGVSLVFLSKYNLSTTDGIQKFAGAFAGGLILAAIGLKLANKKKIKPPSDVHKSL